MAPAPKKTGFFNRLFNRKPFRDQAASLYVRLVEQSRLPVFYTRGGVADSLDGRFDMIVLHMVLLIDRIEKAAKDTDNPDVQAKASELAQALFDYMFDDLDRSLREIGVGDISVPKKIKQMAQAFYGRADAYQSALADGKGFDEALLRNLFRGREDADGAAQVMAEYAVHQRAFMDGQSLVDLMAGTISFQAPEL